MSTGQHDRGGAPRIRVEEADGVCRLVLANPAAHNAVDHAFGEELLAALTGPARAARCVEIVAEGPNFCVGGDIRGFSGAGSLTDLADAVHAGERALLALEAPVVIGVQGWAAGIGLSLALTADVLVMGTSARVRPAYTAIGLTPDGGMTALLPAAVGRARALDLLLTNRPMGAAEALTAGLASRVVDDDALRAEVDALAATVAAGPAAALAATKRLVRSAPAGPGEAFDAHLDAEAASIGERGASAEGREGIAAFGQKRAPDWPR